MTAIHNTTPRNRSDPATADCTSVADRRTIYWIECSCGWRSDDHFDFMTPDYEAEDHLKVSASTGERS